MQQCRNKVFEGIKKRLYYEDKEASILLLCLRYLTGYTSH